MSYQRGYNQGFNRPNNGGYNYRNNNYSVDWNQAQQVRKKRSGSKSGIDKKGRPYVRGWNYSKSRGMVTFFASPYSKTKEHKSQSGRVWENWMVKIQIQRTMEERIVSALYDKMNRKVIIQELAMVLNPSKDYCGTYVRRKNR